jgi:excisionase family DNA binding protein
VREFLSPKQLAEAIGVSESSLRRWADDGRLEVMRTAGGHRRITMAEAVRFIRDTSATVVRPDVLGIGDLESVEEDHRLSRSEMAEQLFNALMGGEASLARGLIMAWYLSGQSISALCDGPVATAMRRLGEVWQHDTKGIFIEHRAVDVCIQAFNQLRLTLPVPPNSAPLAVGGSPEGDPYLLPNIMCATVLIDMGFRAINLGPASPVEILPLAGEHYGAKLVWLSLMAPCEPETACAKVKAAAEKMRSSHTSLVIGGREVGKAIDHMRVPPPNVHFGQSMAELVAFARGLLTHHED